VSLRPLDRPQRWRAPSSTASATADSADTAASAWNPDDHRGTERTRPVARWETRYRRLVVVSDIAGCLVVIGALGAGVFRPREPLAHFVGFAAACLCLVLVSLAAFRTWSPRMLGHGAEEFRRLGRAVLAVVLTFALLGLALKLPDARPWVFGILPVIGVLLAVMRYALRRWLHRARRAGRCMLPVLAAGRTSTLADFIERTRTGSYLGWRVDAACTVDGAGADGAQAVCGVPVLGRFTDLAAHVRRGGYRVLAVTADAYWTPQRLQRLAWELEDTGTQLVVAPVLMDVAGPRLHVSGVQGMPLLRVSAPVFSGARRMIKNLLDIVGSGALLAVLTPAALLVAAAIKLDDRGPVFYRQTRVGRGGRRFTIVKFRTMVAGAEKRQTELASRDEGSGPLFKLRTDPRVTRVGQLLRRYSLDELPQLLNVLTGHMSLVGPRPGLPHEVEQYEDHVHRRTLVKPGLTGLWQVSGRSDLPWEQGVQLDLRYVEDWSLALDAMILWKTLRAVLRAEGAY
jgi:exopolysaccharide biosynthesis polyprenyl glycosylphosphotransferase